MCLAAGCAFAGVGFAREFDGLAGYLAFGQRTGLCQPFDGVPVAVAGGEVHLAVDSGRVLPQRLLDQTHSFDEFPPIGGTQESQALNGVADGNLVAGLLLILKLDQLFN